MSKQIPEIEYSASSLSEVEKKHIEKILKNNNWNINRSAEVLGIERATLYSKISKYGLKK